MADCSAAGTTIDRAARAVLGNSGREAAKHVEALLGSAATMGHSAAAMPLSSPDVLMMPGSSSGTLRAAVAASQGRASAPTSATTHSHHVSAQQLHPASVEQHQRYFQQHHHQNYQQQAMQTMMMQQHQQQMILQQQLNLARSAQQQRHAATRHKSQSNTSAVRVQENWEQWHDGLEEEVANSKFPDQEEVLGHEGITHGASLEELAAAWAQAEAEYEKVADPGEDFSNMWSGAMDAQDEETPYEFLNTEKPEEVGNWMEKGIQHFREGNLKEAVRAFEMELQYSNPDNATAWRMLGRCHAENDMDPEAIKCLEAAVDRDPFSPESLLALGVSYVNELNHEKALENLKAWFTHNPKYAGMELSPDIYTSNTTRGSAFDEVKNMLESAIEYDSSGAGDVHEALGVIYNVNKDYESAAKHFRNAINDRPGDYQLWNKLGATLANGNQSDQAIPAYHEALKLKPKYARAWLNMAISHSNLQNHDEAARCYLQTLSLNPGATHCWTYLRMALSCSERWDLLPLVFNQDLAGFREHFDFVLHQ